jgi:glycosyltransferase involved in cell wall biosynthesis
MRKDRPTILQVIPQLDAGGAELSVVEIAGAIARAGGRALVLAEPGRLAADVANAGGQVIPFPAATKNPLRILANARRMARIAAREGVDLIHARSRAPAWSALLAARRLGVPFVTTYHGAYGERGRAKRLYNSVMARGDVVIANSRFTADLIRARYATPAERIEVIHRGVDTARFDPAAVAPERAAALRQSWGVAPEAPIILQAARLTRWKGQAVLIDAAASLRAQGRLGAAVVVLAGDAQGRDAYVEALRGQVAAQGLAEHVRLVGHVTDMAAAYRAADVTVVASTEPEAFGRTAIEAAAMGCPVIATDLGAPPETVLAGAQAPEAGETGWLVPPRDAAALAERLAQALTLPPAARAALAARVRRHAVQNFSVGAMQKRTLAVYDRLLGTSLHARLAEADESSHSGPPSGLSSGPRADLVRTPGQRS